MTVDTLIAHLQALKERDPSLGAADVIAIAPGFTRFGIDTVNLPYKQAHNPDGRKVVVLQ
jgi:hypothetical protein